MEQSTFSEICKIYLEVVAENPSRREAAVLKKFRQKVHVTFGFSHDKDFILDLIFSRFNHTVFFNNDHE